MILRRHKPRRGVVLLAVLIVVVLLSLAAYRYSDYMLGEYKATDSAIRADQARLLADSGVHYSAALLANTTSNPLAGNPWNNPALFQDILVPSTDKNARPGRFSIIALSTPDDVANGTAPYVFGVTDEASKINLNALLQLDKGQGNVGYNMLMALPNMTDPLANAFIDWLDPDDTPRSSGAESSSYGGLTPAYSAKNGAMDSVEEALLIQNMTPQLLFGNDRNRNGILDKGEDDGTGASSPGLSAYLTVYSRETNVDNTGNPRIYINDPNLNTLYTNLSTAVTSNDLVNYILAYRMYGGSAVSMTAGSKGPPKLNAKSMGSVRTTITQGRTSGGAMSSGGGWRWRWGSSKQKLTNISSLWSLVNSQVSITTGSGRSASTTILPSPLNDPTVQAQLLPLLLDKCTTSQQPEMPGRININTASQTVLTALQAAVPSLQTNDIQSILTNRPVPGTAQPDPIFATPAWLLTRANISLSTITKLDPYITARTQVYRFQAIGYFEKGGPMARVEAVIDTNQGRPRIVYWRDLTELGRAYDLSQIQLNQQGGSK